MEEVKGFEGLLLSPKELRVPLPLWILHRTSWQLPEAGGQTLSVHPDGPAACSGLTPHKASTSDATSWSPELGPSWVHWECARKQTGIGTSTAGSLCSPSNGTSHTVTERTKDLLLVLE